MERTFYVPVPEDEYYERVGDALFRTLQKNGLSLVPARENAKWLTHKEAAQHIRKTPAALYKLTSIKAIRYMKRGKSNIYRTEDLDRYMEAGIVVTADEIRNELQLLPRKAKSATKI